MDHLMLGLVLEVSTERGMIAVFDHEEKIFEEQLPFGLQSSHYALPILQKKIQDGVFKLADLSYIAVGVGPGSYTGIRVGAAIAKTLAFVLKIPLVGVCTLDAFAPNAEGVFAALIDAKIGGAYLQIGRLNNGHIERMSEPKVYPLTEASELLKNIPTIATPNAAHILPKLKGHWNWEEMYPSGERLMQAARKKMAEGAFSMDCKLDLLYMRKTQAEIERDRPDS
jgi:tRNA threonylcarbamoyladenosine biosynthesis protein TsaB